VNEMSELDFLAWSGEILAAFERHGLPAPEVELLRAWPRIDRIEVSLHGRVCVSFWQGLPDPDETTPHYCADRGIIPGVNYHASMPGTVEIGVGKVKERLIG
jgi:hypothetical protein